MQKMMLFQSINSLSQSNLKLKHSEHWPMHVFFSLKKYHKGQEESKRARYGVMSGLIIQSRHRLITQILLGEGKEW